jgi:hypothetical protein
VIPILDGLKELKDGEETVIFVHGQPFVVSRATAADVKRISQGMQCMD